MEDGGLQAFSSVRTIEIPPDPGVLKAIGLNHGLESAAADLVDNSIEASAARVLIRFVIVEDLVRNVLFVDNGNGMSSDEIDAAMALGRRKTDGSQRLGHFGMGLKSASFSQASEFTVLSRRLGDAAEGRRMSSERVASTFDVDVLGSGDVEAAFTRSWAPGLDLPSGTIVQWSGLRRVPRSKNRVETDSYLERTIARLRHHLGLVFHRLLEQRVVAISIDVVDQTTGESGIAFGVEAIDPFGYVRAGLAGYPKELVAEWSDRPLPLHCHIWPGGSDSHQFKLQGAPVDRFQGFYLYRGDRLLTTGEWLGVVDESKQRRLARVAVEIDDHLDGFAMTVEKAGAHLAADLVKAIETARSPDGTTFREYLLDAEQAFKASNQRTSKRSAVLPPGKGLSPRVKRAIAREVPILEGEEPLDIRWKQLDSWDLVDVDRRQRTLWLNARYKDSLLHGTGGGLNNAPVVKALLFLLFEDVFRGQSYGSKDKDNVAYWREILTAAAEDEWQAWNG